MKQLLYSSSVEGKKENIKPVVLDILEAASSLKPGEDALFSLELSLRELMANAIEHGMTTDSQGDILVQLRLEKGRRIVLQVRDGGEGFDWKNTDFSCSDPYLEKGRGISLISSLVNEISFNCRGNEAKVIIDLGAEYG
ncbi:MAG: ATP-binding protein [Clostridia bacterium]|nr:ATP-binding protein [Clostridia bacterium]